MTLNFIFIDGSYFCFYRYYSTIAWWNNAFPENKYGAPEQQTEEQAEHGIDLLLLELLTYEERPALVLMLLPFGDVGEIYGGKALKPYYKLAQELYPEVFERYLAREKIRENRSKQAD